MTKTNAQLKADIAVIRGTVDTLLSDYDDAVGTIMRLTRERDALRKSKMWITKEREVLGEPMLAAKSPTVVRVFGFKIGEITHD